MMGLGDDLALADGVRGLGRNVVSEDRNRSFLRGCSPSRGGEHIVVLRSEHRAQPHLVGCGPDEVHIARGEARQECLRRLDSLLPVPVGGYWIAEDLDTGVLIDHLVESVEPLLREERSGDPFDDGPGRRDVLGVGVCICLLPPLEVEVLVLFDVDGLPFPENSRTAEVVEHGVRRYRCRLGVVEPDVAGNLDVLLLFEQVDHDYGNVGVVSLLNSGFDCLRIRRRYGDHVDVLRNEVFDDGELICECRMRCRRAANDLDVESCSVGLLRGSVEEVGCRLEDPGDVGWRPADDDLLAGPCTRGLPVGLSVPPAGDRHKDHHQHQRQWHEAMSSHNSPSLHYTAVYPPSMTISDPVMYEVLPVARKAMRSAISCGSPRRCAGRLDASQRSWASGSGALAIASSTSGVLVVPGHMETARIPSAAWSAAMDLVSMMSAALERL